MHTDTTLKQLKALFVPGTGFVEIRTFKRIAEQGDRLFEGEQFWLDTATIDADFAKLPDLLAIPNGEIYVGANPRTDRVGTKDSVKVITACYTDLDLKTEDPQAVFQKVMTRPLPPNFVVHSGGGLHLYWLIKPTELKDAWLSAQRGILESFLPFGADKKIASDEARVLRLAPYPNRKKGEVRPTAILLDNSASRYTLDRVMSAYPFHQVQTRNVQMAANADQFSGVLGYKTLQFMRYGAAEGSRNGTLFYAACDMAGNNIPEDVTIATLMPSAITSGLGVREVETTVRSAYSKPREPVLKISRSSMPPSKAAQMTEDKIAQAHGFPDASYGDGPTPSEKPAPPPAPSVSQPPETMPPMLAPEMDMREELANYRWTTDLMRANDKGEVKRVKLMLNADEILNCITRKTGEWPRRLCDLIFVPGRDGAPRVLTTHNQLFAWLMSFFEINWTDGVVSATNGDERTPVDQGKFFEFCRQNAKHVYDSIAPYPHCPSRPDTYYFAYELSDDNDASFNELISRFNPETELDRQLLIAALLTPGWGGPPGARPAFLLMSEHGPGSGKTATAEAIIQTWQDEPFTISATERNWDRARGRFLSDSALLQRCVLIDNVKSELGGNELEQLITGTVIDGHKLHVGHMSRPNLFTWFITMNSPTLSKDLAERAIIIRIGSQKHDVDFKSWSMKFIEERRPYLITSILKRLKRDVPDYVLPSQFNDRWVAWRNEVLAKVTPNVEALKTVMKEVLTRRGQYNAELDDATHIYGEVLQLLKEKHIDPNTSYVKIQAEVLCRRIMERVNKDIKSVKGATLFLKKYLKVPPLTCLERDTSERGRCIWYLYKGPMTTLRRPNQQITAYESAPEDVDLYRDRPGGRGSGGGGSEDGRQQVEQAGLQYPPG